MAKSPNRKIVSAIVELIKKWEKEYPDQKLIIGVDGSSGTGKSTISSEIAKKKKVTLVQIDHFLTPWKKRKKLLDTAKNKMMVYENHWYDLKEFRKLVNLFKDPKRKKVYLISHSNIYPKKKKKKIKYNLNTKVLLVDGVFLLNKKIYGKIFDKTIFLEIPKKYLAQRRRIRYSLNNRSGKYDSKNKYSQLFNKAWEDYLKRFNPARKSDVVVKINIVSKLT